MTRIRVRLFAALREEAGASHLESEGATAGEVVDALGRRFGERADRATALVEGDELALLPPVAGG